MSILIFLGLYVLCVVAPIVFWFWFFLSKDRAEPEPRKLLFIVFLLGLGVFLFSFAAEGVIFSLLLPEEYNALMTEGIVGLTDSFSMGVALLFILAGVVEEIIKYFVIYAFVYHKTEWNQIADGVFYAVSLALGFAFIENTSYFYELSSAGSDIFLAAIITRAVATTMLHLTTTGILGYAFGKMKFTAGHSRFLALGALVIAIIIHSGFNFLIQFPYGMLIIFPALFGIFLYLLKLLRKGETKLVWKLVTPQQKAK